MHSERQTAYNAHGIGNQAMYGMSHKKLSQSVSSQRPLQQLVIILRLILSA